MAMEQARMEEAQRLAQGMEAARVGAMTNIPSYGPPTAAGEMSPAVQQFDWNRYAQGVEGVDPMRALAIRQAIAPKAAEMPYDKPKPEHYTPESLAKFAASRNPADLVMVAKPDASTVGKINLADFTPASVQAYKAGGERDYGVLVPVDRTPRTTVNVTNPMETEEQKSLGKARAESFVTLSKAGSAARGKLQQLDAIESLVGNVETSPLTPIGMKAAGYGAAVGLTLDPTLPQKQAADTIVKKMALDARSTADGAGMPGAMSDADREFLLNSVPNLTQTREGRRAVVTVTRRLAKRQQEYATLANQYRKERGTFDEGFEDYARQYFADKPLFTDMGAVAPSGRAPSGGLTPAEQRELDDLRRKFGGRK